MCVVMLPFAGAFVFLPLPVAVAALLYRWLFGTKRPEKGWVGRRNMSQGRSPQPAEVLIFLSGVCHCKEDPERTFFSIRFTRVFDSRPKSITYSSRAWLELSQPRDVVRLRGRTKSKENAA